MPITSRSTERTNNIVKAAAQLFALQGYHRTSTREIARLADVSENTLFRHFNHKEDLFWSAIRSLSTGLKLRRDLLEGVTKCDAPEVVLPKIVDLLTDTVTFSPELLRLIAVAFLELHSKADVFSKKQLSPVFSTINQYLTRSMEAGKVREMDPTIATVALVTTVLLHSGLLKLIEGDRLPYADSREAARAYTKFWLNVLGPGTVDHRQQVTPITKRPSA
jgi:AcrR family transcriptional regulator